MSENILRCVKVTMGAATFVSTVWLASLPTNNDIYAMVVRSVVIIMGMIFAIFFTADKD